jgi:cell division control protein 7
LGEQIGAGTFSAVHRAVLNESRYQVYEYAVKRFYQTNDPRRIQQEVRFLCELEGEPGVPRLEGVFRRDNEVWLVMPLYRCEPFRLLIAEMRVSDMRAYMRQLLKVLAVLERHEIIHRDVKPGNFLFHRAYPGSAVLVDFGLAQWHRRAHKLRHGVHRLMPDMYAAKLQPSSAPAQNSRHLKLTTTREHFEDWQLAMTAPVFAAAPTGTTKSTTGQSARTILPSRQKPRALVEAPRAGTRGFRAPEILLRFLEQDTRIDVWSAGVIFLSMLSRRYPFFRANGDDEALLELEQVLGTERLAATAKACHRSFASAERMPGMDLRHLCLQLRTAQRPTEAVDTDIPDEAFDLLGKMLEPNCFQRPRASDLQDHPFLRDPHA